MAARWGATATLLRDGRVLIVGGGPFQPKRRFPVSPTVIVDVDAGRWTYVPDPAQPRAFHSAARLGSGRVLIVGGGPDTDNSGEYFGPALNNWSDYAGRRFRWTGKRPFLFTLPGRRVLVMDWAQRYWPASPDTWFWCGAERRWHRIDSPPCGDPAAGVLGDGSVLMLGRRRDPAVMNPVDWQLQPEVTAWRFFPGTKEWLGAGAPFIASGRPALAPLPGRGALAVGGGVWDFPAEPPPAKSAARRYDARDNSWHPAPPMLRPCLLPRLLALQDGRVLALAREHRAGAGPSVAPPAEIYCPEREEWRRVPGSPIGTGFAQLLLADGRVLCLRDTHRSPAGAVFDPAAERWTPVAPPPYERLAWLMRQSADRYAQSVRGAPPPGGYGSTDVPK